MEEAIAHALRGHKNLKSLEIFHFKTNGLALKAALKETACLEHFSLSEMNPKAIKALAEGLAANTSLKYLNVNHSYINDKMVSCFLDALRANKNIISLKLYNCGLSQTDLEQMQAIVAANRLARQQIQA